MSIFELALILAASPVIGILIFGTWRFSDDGNINKQPSPTSASIKPI